MGIYTSENIRNVVLLGHGGCGKSTLMETMAYVTGITKRMKKTEEGGTVSDYDKEEISRQISVNLSMLPVEWEGTKINVLDTPGSFDFKGEVYQALSVADGAIILISGRDGVLAGTIKAFEYCKEMNIPCMVFVADMDDPEVDFMKTVNKLKEWYGKQIAPFHLPLYEENEFVGFVNVVKMGGRKFKNDGTYEEYDVPDSDTPDEELDACREMILEAVAETSEELMDKFFNGEEFTQEEISMALRENVHNGTIIPVLMGESINGKGIRMLLTCIEKYFSSPAGPLLKKEGKDEKTGDVFYADYDESKPLSMYIFKTIVDPFIGKFSLFKVCSGVVKQGMSVYNCEKDIEEKIAKLYTFIGGKAVEVTELHAGDIGAVAKLSGTKTGHTLSTKSNPITFESFEMPVPYTFMAYQIKQKGDEDKVSSALHKLMDEDLTLKEVNDKANGQLLLYGIGEQQLDVVVSKLKNRYKVEIELVEPKVAYKETIRKKVLVQGRHKKQSGGHGQFGDVKMEFEPLGDNSITYEFNEKVFGGAVPKNYFPAVEKGIEESCKAGPLAGYPVVGVKATLVDGSYHPVDSSEMAFKMASTIAFKNGVLEASPVLLEPIVELKVLIPDKFTGDIMADLNKRRGRIIGMNPIGEKKQEIVAEIPMKSLLSYSTTLLSMTGGAGEYKYEFARYEEMPADVQKKILEKK